MLDLRRRDGRPLVVGHRGAPELAPENTIASFRAAVELGVDVVELDVLALESGMLVVAHSDRLEEVTHGAASGLIGRMALRELRDLAPALPTFEETLRWFADEAPATGIHVDLKLRSLEALDGVAEALERHGLAPRAVVSSAHAIDLRRIAGRSSRLVTALTYPNDRLGVARRRALRPAVRAGLSALRASVPVRLPRLLARAGAGALMLQHALVGPAVVARAHRAGVPVLAWTVDDPVETARVVSAGVDGVITNDPAGLLATLAT